MGGLFSSIFDTLWGPYRYKIAMVGLDAAGKTSILFKLSLGEIVATQPTIGSNVEHLVYKNIDFVVYDVGGQSTYRLMWNDYFGQDTDVVILVIDSADRERLPMVKYELDKIMQLEELKNAVILLFANKQDLPNCMTPLEIVEQLELQESKRSFHIQGCSVIDDQDGGLNAGIAWVASQLKH